MRKSLVLASLAAVVMTAPATAQIQPDFTQIGQAVNAIAWPATMNMCNAGLCGPQKSSSSIRGRPGVPIAFSNRAPAISANTPASVGTYQPNAALAREALAGYVQRIRRTNPQVASQVDQQFRQHNYQTIYNSIVGDLGFRSDSVSDAMAAYMAVAWIIANGVNREPTRAEVLGLRRQFAARVAGNQTVLANKAKLGEELKLLLVTVHSGFRSSMREGNQRHYADGVAAMIRKQYDLDLRSLRLTPMGFQDRS
jgi:hypothetical protein